MSTTGRTPVDAASAYPARLWGRLPGPAQPGDDVLPRGPGHSNCDCQHCAHGWGHPDGL